MSTRSRKRERIRLTTPVQTTDPAAMAAYAAELRPAVAKLRALVEDATVPASKRVHSRLYLRSEMLRAVRELETRIAAAAPPEPDANGAPSDPAGNGVSPTD